MTTTATFRHIDLSAQAPGITKPWGKVDGGGSSFTLAPHSRPVHDLREAQAQDLFNTDTAGFALHTSPSAERDFVDDAAVRGPYYDEIEALLRKNLSSSPASSAAALPSQVAKVVIFDHTIRRRLPGAPRSPVQQVHVDQTPEAARARVRRHVRDQAEAERLIAGRFQIVNVWRPIGAPASDHPLAVIDWRSTRPEDFVPVDLLYPKRERSDSGVAAVAASAEDDEDDDRGKEKLAPAEDNVSTEGYEAKGETFGVAPSDLHRFYYARDMRPDEVLLLKCYDSAGEGEPLGADAAGAGADGRRRIAVRTPHTAFEDPNTPTDAPPRQSIEVRALVFYE